MPTNFAQGEVSRKRKFRVEMLHLAATFAQQSGMKRTMHTHLRAHRKLARMTQEQVAGILDIAHNTYSEKERGLKPITLDELEKLAEMYGLHPVALLMAPEDGPRADLIRRASEVARTRPPGAAQDWLRSGEHIPPEDVK